MFSVVIPVYRNAETLAPLLEALAETLAGIPEEAEAVFVVDGSPDDSAAILMEALPSWPFPSHVVLFARNFGAFNAIRAGLQSARGERIAVVAADLQEPPELIQGFHQALSRGPAEVVFGRRTRRDDPAGSSALSALYWAGYRRFVLPDIPPGGVDTFACTRKVRDAILELEEHHTSLVALLFWLGYERGYVDYERRARGGGTSAWTLAKRVQYFLDSVYGFTDLPVRLLSAVGFGGILASVILGVAVAVARLVGDIPVPGYAALMITVLFFGALNLFAVGIVGGYLWRAFENTKERPHFVVAHSHTFPGGSTTP